MLITNPTTKQIEELEEFILHHPNGNFFQSPQAFQFFKSVDNFDPVLLVAKDNGEITGLLMAISMENGVGIKRFFSQRCIFWGGPLVNSDDPQTIRLLLHELKRLAKRKAIYIEIRNLFDTADFKDAFQSIGFEYREHLNYIVEINNIEENKKKLSSTRRRQIKKAFRNGAVIEEAKTKDDVGQFYAILLQLYREKVKKPLPGLDFFLEFYRRPNLGRIFVVKAEKKVVGGIMCPIFSNTIYEWYVCGLDNEYKDFYPSVMATWAPIEFGAKNGLKYFDFMGAGRPEADYGVREFKSKFGGKLVNYGRYIHINNTFLYPLGKLGLKFYQKLNF